MSVSKWAYTPEVCDGGGCPGDCDLCDKPKNMEDEDDMTDYIKREDAIDAINKAEVKDIAVDRVRRISPADVRDDATAHKLVCGGDRDGYICVASTIPMKVKGAIVPTPFGKFGKCYDCGAGSNKWRDIYVSF